LGAHRKLDIFFLLLPIKNYKEKTGAEEEKDKRIGQAAGKDKCFLIIITAWPYSFLKKSYCLGQF